MADKKIPSIWDGRENVKTLAGKRVVDTIKEYFPVKCKVKKVVSTVECLEDGRIVKADMNVEFYPKAK